MVILSKNSTIAVVSPSWGGVGIFPDRYQRAVDFMKSAYNIELVLMDNAAKAVSYASASAKERADDLHQAFADDKYSAIWAAIGGDHSIEMFPYLDNDLITKNKKPFIGYSDNTTLCNYLEFYCGSPVVYGPSLLNEFAEFPKPFQYTIDCFENTLLNNDTEIVIPQPSQSTDELGDWAGEIQKPRTLHDAEPWQFLRGNNIKGKPFGGCLESVRQLLGTKWQKCLTGDIFCLEAAELSGGIGDIVRDITHIKNAGVFEKISGLLLGRWYGLDASEQNEANKTVNDLLAEYDFPILANVDFGHTDPQMFLPFGSTLESDGKTITLKSN